MSNTKLVIEIDWAEFGKHVSKQKETCFTEYVGQRAKAAVRLQEKVEVIHSASDVVVEKRLPKGSPYPTLKDISPYDLAKLIVFAQEGNRVHFLKKWRELTGLGLKEAKEFMDKVLFQVES